MSLLLQFIYLQLLDSLTTLAFLLNGVKEANPLVRLALEAGPSPVVGLLAVKLVAVLLALFCVRRARLRLLARVNIFFALLVAWNLIIIIIISPSLALLTRSEYLLKHFSGPVTHLGQKNVERPAVK